MVDPTPLYGDPTDPNEPPIVRVDPIDVQERLAGLAGLDAATLEAAIGFGVGYRNECTLNDPIIAPGFLCWEKIIRGLRDRHPRWKRERERNFELTVDPEGRIAIAVIAGNSLTGHPDRSPATARPRGKVTQEVLDQRQKNFLHLVPEEPDPHVEAPIWVVLYHIDVAAGEWRAELSQPTGMTKDGEVRGWRERIILPRINDRTVIRIGDEVDDDHAPDVDVFVERLAN